MSALDPCLDLVVDLAWTPASYPDPAGCFSVLMAVLIVVVRAETLPDGVAVADVGQMGLSAGAGWAHERLHPAFGIAVAGLAVLAVRERCAAFPWFAAWSAPVAAVIHGVAAVAAASAVRAGASLPVAAAVVQAILVAKRGRCPFPALAG